MGATKIRCLSYLVLFFGLLSAYSPSAISQDSGTPVLKSFSAHKLKRAKTIDDINAIGQRKISGSRIGNWYSPEKEIKLGQEYSNDVESFTKPLKDPFITEYVNRVGQNLVRNSDAKVPFVIKVIDSQEINAFALPGGFLYVNSGLLLAAEDEAELAGIMAHEIAHVAARHATRQMTRSEIFDLVSLPLIAFGGGIVVAARETVGSLTAMKFSRNYECEADYLAVEYAYKAGYDPSALISILERLQVDENQTPGALAKALSTHPQTRQRIRKMQAEIARILPPRSTYIVSTSDFDEMHSRLATRAATRLGTRPDAGRPTLRRRETPDENGPKQSDRGPVLNRP